MTNHDHDPNDLSQTGYPVDEPQQAVDNRTRNLRLALFGIILTAIFFHLIGVGLLVFDSLVAGREVDERAETVMPTVTPIGGDATATPTLRPTNTRLATATPRDAVIVTPPQFVPPAVVNTNTPIPTQFVPPSSTPAPSQTPIPSATPIPPTATPTLTDTLLPQPTATATQPPPTATATQPPPTATATQPPPTATATATATQPPPTATQPDADPPSDEGEDASADSPDRGDDST